MRRPFLFSLLLLFCLMPYTLPAQTPQVSASLSDELVPLNREVLLTVTVSGIDQQNAQVVHFPDLVGFELLSTSRSSNIQIANGQMHMSVSWIYTLMPQKEGRFVIPPIEVQIGTEKYKTRPLAIEIKPASALPDEQKRQSVDDPFNGGRQFVDVHLDRPTAYVNQPVVYSFRYYSTAALPSLDAPRYERPDFQGFWFREWPVQGIRREVIDNVTYRMQEIQTTLFAQSAGTYTIPAPTLRVPGLSFFDQPRILRGQPVTITVKPLPGDGVPVTFNGAVGSYQLKATADKQTLKLGEALTLTLQVEGRGHFDSLVGPVLPTLPGFTRYDPTVRSEFTGTGPQPDGYKRFEYVLIPEEAGTQIIPAVQWSYFDPDGEQYRELSTSSITVSVQDAPVSKSTPVVASVSSGNPGDGLQEIRPDTIKLTRQGQSPYTQPSFWIWQGVWLTVLALGWGYSRHRASIQEPFRARQLTKRVDRDLEALHSYPGSSQEFAAQLSQVVREYLAERWGISGELHHALSSSDGNNGRDLKSVSELLSRLEQVRYSPALLDRTQHDQLLQTARETLDRLEQS